MDWQLNLKGLTSLTRITLDTYDQYWDRRFDEERLGEFLSKQRHLKILQLHFNIRRMWSPGTFLYLPANLESLFLGNADFSLPVCQAIQKAVPQLKDLAIMEYRQRGRFAPETDMSEFALILTGFNCLRFLGAPYVPDWKQLPPPPNTLELLSVPFLYRKETTEERFKDPATFPVASERYFEGWPSNLAFNCVSTSHFSGLIHPLNWMIQRNASLQQLKEAFSNYGLRPYEGRLSHITTWCAWEPTLFVAVEANRLDVVKWLIEDIQVYLEPQGPVYKGATIFHRAWLTASIELLDYLFHTVAAKMGVSYDFIFGNFVSVETPPIIAAAKNRNLQGAQTVIQWLLDPKQRRMCEINLLQLDSHGRSALFYCFTSDLKRLVYEGLDINHTDRSHGSVALHRILNVTEKMQAQHSAVFMRADSVSRVEPVLRHPEFAPTRHDVQSMFQIACHDDLPRIIEIFKEIAFSREQYLDMLEIGLKPRILPSYSVKCLKYVLEDQISRDTVIPWVLSALESVVKQDVSPQPSWILEHSKKILTLLRELNIPLPQELSSAILELVKSM